MLVWGETFYNSQFINNTHLTQACLGVNDGEYWKPGFNVEMLMPKLSGRFVHYLPSSGPIMNGNIGLSALGKIFVRNVLEIVI